MRRQNESCAVSIRYKDHCPTEHYIDRIPPVQEKVSIACLMFTWDGLLILSFAIDAAPVVGVVVVVVDDDDDVFLRLFIIVTGT